MTWRSGPGLSILTATEDGYVCRGHHPLPGSPQWLEAGPVPASLQALPQQVHLLRSHSAEPACLKLRSTHRLSTYRCHPPLVDRGCSCVLVSVRALICVCNLLQRPAVNFSCLCSGASTSVRRQSLCHRDLGLTGETLLADLNAQAMSPNCWGSRHALSLACYLGSGGPNSGLHVCTAKVLYKLNYFLADPSLNFFFFKVYF